MGRHEVRNRLCAVLLIGAAGHSAFCVQRSSERDPDGCADSVPSMSLSRGRYIRTGAFDPLGAGVPVAFSAATRGVS